jgi:hypothetical protein
MKKKTSIQIVHIERVETTELHDPIFTAHSIKFQALVPERMDVQIIVVHFGKGVWKTLRRQVSSNDRFIALCLAIQTQPTDSVEGLGAS